MTGPRTTSIRSEPGTYIAEILQLRDSSLARWPDRAERPLTIWIQPLTTIDDWTENYVDQIGAGNVHRRDPAVAGLVARALARPCRTSAHHLDTTADDDR